MSDFGERIKTIMRLKGIRVDELCALTGKKQPTISSYLTGRTFPNEDFFIALTKLIPEINLHFIITGEGEPYLSEPAFLKSKVKELETREKQLTDTIIRMGTMIGGASNQPGQQSKSKGVFVTGNFMQQHTVVNTPWQA